MPIKVTDPDTGVESEAFTIEEMEAQKISIQTEANKKIADNEAHLALKLDEFQKGKNATELEKETEKNKTAADIADARRIAEEAAATVRTTEERRVSGLKKMAIERFVGNDPDLTKKMEEAWAVINIPTVDDTDFMKKAEAAANMSGINSAPNIMGAMPFGGGMPPSFQQKKEVNEAEHTRFRDALGDMNDFLAKPNEQK